MGISNAAFMETGKFMRHASLRRYMFSEHAHTPLSIY